LNVLDASGRIVYWVGGFEGDQGSACHFSAGVL